MFYDHLVRSDIVLNSVGVLPTSSLDGRVKHLSTADAYASKYVIRLRFLSSPPPLTPLHVFHINTKGAIYSPGWRDSKRNTVGVKCQVSKRKFRNEHTLH